ncbi:MAG: DUF3822 family protein, partial [Tannerella sp.]|nr:DUF3822 family protein [Tannerella sp.]
PGGLSFAGHIPSEKDSFFYAETSFDRVRPYVQVLKETFSEHAFFAYPYRQTYVVCADRMYTPVPARAFAAKHTEALMSFVYLSPTSKALHEPIEELELELLFSFPEEAYTCCSHSLTLPQFTHAITHNLRRWRRQSARTLPRQLCVSVHERIMDAACFDRGTLLFLNSFEVESVADMLYYILYIWKQTGTADELLLSAAPPLYGVLADTLRKYVSHIAPLHPSAEVEAGKALVPLDIISLFGCES